MISNVGFMDLRAGSALASSRDPDWRATGVEDEPELFTFRFNPEMFDIGASQAAPANETIARRTWPACFY